MAGREWEARPERQARVGTGDFARGRRSRRAWEACPMEVTGVVHRVWMARVDVRCGAVKRRTSKLNQVAQSCVCVLHGSGREKVLA